MIGLIDVFFNQYLRVFVGIVLVGLILFSLYFKSYKVKIIKNLKEKIKSFNTLLKKIQTKLKLIQFDH